MLEPRDSFCPKPFSLVVKWSGAILYVSPPLKICFRYSSIYVVTYVVNVHRIYAAVRRFMVGWIRRIRGRIREMDSRTDSSARPINIPWCMRGFADGFAHPCAQAGAIFAGIKRYRKGICDVGLCSALPALSSFLIHFQSAGIEDEHRHWEHATLISRPLLRVT